MNVQARIDRYRARGFPRVEAEILVLIEESAAALFASFPDHFILFGGVTLVLFYESPRLSRDLDLLTCPSQIPKPEEIQAAVRSSIQPIAETLGLGQLEFRKDIDGPDFLKHWVIANKNPSSASISPASAEMCWKPKSSRRPLPALPKKLSLRQAQTTSCSRNVKRFLPAVR